MERERLVQILGERSTQFSRLPRGLPEAGDYHIIKWLVRCHPVFAEPWVPEQLGNTRPLSWILRMIGSKQDGLPSWSGCGAWSSDTIDNTATGIRTFTSMRATQSLASCEIAGHGSVSKSIPDCEVRGGFVSCDVARSTLSLQALLVSGTMGDQRQGLLTLRTESNTSASELPQKGGMPDRRM